MYSPFSSSPVDAPLPAEDGKRLLPVERTPFLQAPVVSAEVDQAQDWMAVAGPRRLGPGGAAFQAGDADR
ncbi:hypothetical protein [Kitasatospora indigofera]|uniref:hypothetical protein n=1 Tax=Kitasatospora indigofera TaxID=67307 RepID=UPI0036A23BD9